ncbi:MAG: hypothetical protein JXQ75_23335 [Phycisphaerae bacterium]|nr:hypothetical protein [Phycisphaerae bacterium]
MAADDDEQRALAAYLDEQHLSNVAEFAPKDDEDLDAELCAGRFDRVVFAGLDALLTAVWKGHARIDRWAAAGVRIELATQENEECSDWQSFVTKMYDSLARWRKAHRKRQIVAATLLSTLALIALAVLLFLTPPVR